MHLDKYPGRQALIVDKDSPDKDELFWKILASLARIRHT
jgi:hypothetical protein